MKMPKLLIIGVLTAMFSVSAQAELEKTRTKINFNEMIESTDQQKAELRDSMVNHYAERKAERSLDKEKQRVMEFVDVEVGLSDDKALVDADLDSATPVPEMKENQESKPQKTDRGPSSITQASI